MIIAPGTRLGSCEVGSQIGAVGMGDVYRPHETKLARGVAIKGLPRNLVNDPWRLVRWREARMLAAPTKINVVLNWFEELKQKVHVGKK